MRLIVVGMFVAIATAVFAWVPGDSLQQPVEWVQDPDAYAVYASVLPAIWSGESRDVLLLQRETDDLAHVRRCVTEDASRYIGPEWQAVLTNFIEMSARTRLLEPRLPVNIPYRFIARAEILADAARLQQTAPATWERERLKFAAVSAVGFNPTKDKAMVYVGLRSSGWTYSREWRDNAWVAGSWTGCGWIA